MCAIGIAALSGGWLFDAFAAFSPDVRYGAPTVLLLGLAVALCGLWPASDLESPPVSRPWRNLWAAAAVALGVWICANAVAAMLPMAFAGRINSLEADMLVLIDRGVRRMLAGGNPYTVYQVPWDAPLAYGPYLFGPFIVPIALNADPRLLPLIALLIVTGACIWAATATARAGRLSAAALFLLLAWAMALNPAVVQFFRIGHTPVYWPLLLVFAWLLQSGRWTGAAVACGSLIVARTTMVALAPVLLMFYWHRGLLTRWRLLALIAAAALPFVPFLVADASALAYALYGVYPKVIKGFVWLSTGAHFTIGLTGFLLRHGMQRYAELGQAIAMLGVYGAAWLALRRGARPEPWLVLALLVFSMTTLWPVIYVYFDVFVLAAVALGCTAIAPARPVRDLVVGLGVLAVAATGLVAGSAAIDPGASPAIDLGTHQGAIRIDRGLDRDQRALDGERTFASVAADGVVVLRLPRASRSSTSIHLIVRGGAGAGAQRVTVWLNGHSLGQSVLLSEWDDLAFRAPRRAWFYGANTLELRFTSTLAAEKSDAGRGPDRAAIDFVKVEP